jgi:hypothetical protein
MAMLSVLAPIDIPVIPDAKDQHDQLVIVNPVDDPVFAHPNPIEIVLSLELDRPSGPRADGKLVDSRGDPSLDGLREICELPAG